MSYFASRLLQACLLLQGVSLLSFLFLELSPGSFVDEMKLNPQISQETVASLRTAYGLDQPLPSRYLHWLRSVAKGEFGFSFAYNTPVAPLLRARAQNTLMLTGSATLLAWLIALPLGIVSAEKPNKFPDYAVAILTSALLAIPDLLLALVFLLVAVRTHWLPAGGMTSLDVTGESTWIQLKNSASHLVGPVIVLTLGGLPIIIRHTKSAMAEALRTPYVRASRAHGISRSRILLRHALPVAANPLISLFALSFGSLLSASLLIEVVMSWPGLGPLLFEAIMARDFYVVIGAVIFAAIFFAAGTLIGDVLLFLADPRIRTENLA
jgi:peptide/nickel transport system permease protein